MRHPKILFKKKLLIIGILTAILLLPLLISAQSGFQADEICGEWWTPEEQGRMIFFRSCGYYYGKVSWIINPNDENGNPKVEEHNPDLSKRGKPYMGMILFSDFSWDAEKEKYVGGTVYDVRSGNTYDCWMKLLEKNVLEIHGYLAFSLLGKSAYFTRVQ